MKKRDVVEDERGNRFAVLAVDKDGRMLLRSVATKQEYLRVPADAVTLVPGLREAL